MLPLSLIFLGIASVLGSPEVFDDYFDDSIREVDVDQPTAILGCLADGQATAQKMQNAYKKCFKSDDYSISDLADNNGPDGNRDGFPDSFNENEACFYKEMGWVQNDNAQADVIKADMNGLESALSTEFEANIDECAAWNGEFSGRLKRAAGDLLPAVFGDELGSRVRRQVGRLSGQGPRPGGGNGGPPRPAVGPSGRKTEKTRVGGPGGRKSGNGGSAVKGGSVNGSPGRPAVGPSGSGRKTAKGGPKITCGRTRWKEIRKWRLSCKWWSS